MNLELLEKVAGCKFPKDYKHIFGKYIDNNRKITLKLHNDDYTIISKFISKQDMFDYDYLVEECFIPCLKRNNMYNNNEFLLPFAKSNYGDADYYLYFKIKKYIFRPDHYSIWLNHIDASSPPIKISDSISHLIDLQHYSDSQNNLVFEEKKKNSHYLKLLPFNYYNPKIDWKNEYFNISHSNLSNSWKVETYCTLSKSEIKDKPFRYEEIIVEHIINFEGYVLHYQLPFTYFNTPDLFWFNENWIFSYGMKDNHRNMNFYRKIEYIFTSLNQLIEVKLKELDTNINMLALLNFIDKYDINKFVNKSHLEIELSIID